MPAGFFPSSTLVGKPPVPLVPRCGLCQLYQHCTSPKMPVWGQGKKRVLICGESPAETEDREGRPFAGKAGEYLRKVCSKFDFDLDEDAWITNATICKPSGQDGRWRNPTDAEIEHCRPNLMNAIKERRPDVVVLLGGGAILSLIGGIWREDPGAASKWVGWQIPYRRWNCWVCPNYHPSYCQREDDPVLHRYFEDKLGAALALRGKPWPDGPPDPRKQIMCVLNGKTATWNVRQYIKQGKPVAIDIENNFLKPDGKDAKIISCAVSDGKATMAYPWHGEAVRATEELLQSNVGKIAANMKHEIRWFKKVFGSAGKRWIFDTMLASHVIDNREGICGLKFQSFVRLGVESYDDHIKPFMKGHGGKGLNQLLSEVDLNQLLLYNGMDALLEHQLAEIQAKELGVELC